MKKIKLIASLVTIFFILTSNMVSKGQNVNNSYSDVISSLKVKVQDTITVADYYINGNLIYNQTQTKIFNNATVITSFNNEFFVLENATLKIDNNLNTVSFFYLSNKVINSELKVIKETYNFFYQQFDRNINIVITKTLDSKKTWSKYLDLLENNEPFDL